MRGGGRAQVTMLMISIEKLDSMRVEVVRRAAAHSPPARCARPLARPVRIGMYMHVCICMYVYVCMYMYIYIYTYI